MAELFENQERTEEATQKKREDARAHGRFARSADLSTALVLLGVALLLLFWGGTLVRQLQVLLASGLRSIDGAPVSFEASIAALRRTLLDSVRLAGPFLLVGSVIAAGVHFLQAGGFFVVRDAFALKPDRFDVAANFARFFSARSGVKVAASLCKLLVIAGAMGFGMRARFEDLALLADLPLEVALLRICELVLQLFLRAAGALVVLGFADWLFQRWQHERDLRMTKQERRDEDRHETGDPELRRRVRQRQREIAGVALEQAVPKATVIVTNPTHVAVALRYEEGKSSAPTVVAKGLDRVAETIKRLARDHDIPCVEQPTLARALFRDVPVGDTIPERLYRAVAGVLATVFKLKQERARRRKAGAAAPATVPRRTGGR